MHGYSTPSAGHPGRPLGNTPSPVHRPPNLSSTHTGPLTPSTDTFIRRGLTRVVPALGQRARPCAPFAINVSGRPPRIPQLKRQSSSYCFSSSRWRRSGCGDGFRHAPLFHPLFGVTALVAEVRTDDTPPVNVLTRTPPALEHAFYLLLHCYSIIYARVKPRTVHDELVSCRVPKRRLLLQDGLCIFPTTVRTNKLSMYLDQLRHPGRCNR